MMPSPLALLRAVANLRLVMSGQIGAPQNRHFDIEELT